MYHVFIVEGPRSGDPCEHEKLEHELNRLRLSGYDIDFVLTNGVNRWTVICRKG